MNKPNFFIVGAPKCGTSSLYHWLRHRPDIFMPQSDAHYWRYKEPFHFCPDLVAPPHRVEAEEYARHFAPAADTPLRGEASALYLASEEAAARIYKAAPEAKIIICLRHPADFIISWWRDCLYWGHEDEFDFARATDPARSLKSLPARCWYPRALNYHGHARFSAHIKRYTDIFARDQLHFVWLDDMRRDPEGVLSGVLSFLGAAPHAIGPALTPHNAARSVRRSQPAEQAAVRRLQGLPGGALVSPLVHKAAGLFYKDVSMQLSAEQKKDLRRTFTPEYQGLLTEFGSSLQ